MNAKIKALSAFFMVAVILGSVPLLVSANGNVNEWPLGKDIASTFRGVLGRHQGDVEGFIFENKVSVADTIDAKLGVIDEYIHDGEGSLRGKIDALRVRRETLIAALQAGVDTEGNEFTMEDFEMGMKDLATDLVVAAKTMGKIGEKLYELSEGYEIAGPLKARAEDLADDLQACKEDATWVANAVLDALRERKVPAQAVIDALKEAEVIPVEVPELPEEVPAELPGGMPGEPPGEVPEEESEESGPPEGVPPGRPPGGAPEGEGEG